ncbi:MAG: hypothetical protein KBT04_07765 [Bacteroidales bacterium]|nr:hypothetical protein [Candidatus Colimorpha onthohippi]
MGTFKQGILGGFSGKVGTVIGSFWKGRNVMRSIAQHVHNPQTAAQMNQRARFSMISRMIAASQTFVDQGYQNHTATETAGNAAMRDNLGNGCISGTYPTLTIDYTKVTFSKGTHINVDSPSVTQDTGHSATVTWTDNTGVAPEVLGSDVVMVMLYNISKTASTYDISSATRSDQTLTVSYPATWVGDTIHCFVVTKSSSGLLMSGTINAGNFVAA